jgi:hypothetical protein
MGYNSCMGVSRLELLKLLTSRLERLSVDSRWARRASGLRGNIMKLIEQAETGQVVAPERLDALIERSFEILRSAAREIPDLDEEVNRYTPRSAK